MKCLDSFERLSLRDYSTAIKLGCYEMHRSAMMTVFSVQGALMGVQAFIFGKKGGVYVQNLFWPRGNKLRL